MAAAGAIFPDKTFIAYARPTRERLTLELIEELAAAKRRVPAFAYSIVNATPSNVEKKMANLPNAVRVRMLVPDLDLIPEKASKSARYSFTKNIPSLTATATQTASWLAEVMEAQVDGGATVLLTPSLLLENGHGEVELRRILEWADTARSLRKVQAYPVVTGLVMGRDWLVKEEKRENLLNVLTEVPDPAFQITVHWPQMGSYSQVNDSDALRGYREVVEVLEDDSREVIAARAGLAGWMLAACGAAAYSAGVYPSHIYKDSPTIRRSKGSHPPPRIPHYLDGKLLSYIPEARLAAVSAISGPPNCSCPDCSVLAGGYQEPAAFRHLLRLHSRLAATLASKTEPRVFARGKVLAAMSLIENNPLQLPTFVTSHLDVWQDVLS